MRYRELGRESRDENALTEFDRPRLRVGRRRHSPRPARRAQFVSDDLPIFHLPLFWSLGFVTKTKSDFVRNVAQVVKNPFS